MAYDDKLDGGGKRLPTSVEILSNVPRKDVGNKDPQAAGNPHLQAGELRKAWAEEKRGKK
jgi:hypothetical protein